MKADAIRIARRIAHALHGEDAIDSLNALAAIAAHALFEARRVPPEFVVVLARAYAQHVEAMKEKNAMRCSKCWEPSGNYEFCERHDPDRKAAAAASSPPSTPPASSPSVTPSEPAKKPDEKA